MNFDYIHNVVFADCYRQDVGEDFTRMYTLKEHIDRLSLFEHSKNVKKILCIFTIMIDWDKSEDDIKEKIMPEYQYLKKLETKNLKIKILNFRNWGGMYGGMWLVWDKFLKPKKITAKYFGSFEDDWAPCKNKWLEKAIVRLNEGYIYVGHLWNNSPAGMEWSKADIEGYIKRPYRTNSNGYVWTDGGIFITKFESLEKIEKQTGPFVKAPYDDSIDFRSNFHNRTVYGELAFPTRLHEKGFKFLGSMGYFTATYEWDIKKYGKNTLHEEDFI